MKRVIGFPGENNPSHGFIDLLRSMTVCMEDDSERDCLVLERPVDRTTGSLAADTQSRGLYACWAMCTELLSTSCKHCALLCWGLPSSRESIANPKRSKASSILAARAKPDTHPGFGVDGTKRGEGERENLDLSSARPLTNASPRRPAKRQDRRRSELNRQQQQGPSQKGNYRIAEPPGRLKRTSSSSSLASAFFDL
ncbi:12114_t:CDS:2, partial [Acaulospora colombiana]